MTAETLLAALKAMDPQQSQEISRTPSDPQINIPHHGHQPMTEETADQEIKRRIDSEILKRLRAIEEHTAAKPEPVYRSELGPREKARLMEQLGVEKYQELPMYRPGASKKWGRR
jgi:hypothetical protein